MIKTNYLCIKIIIINKSSGPVIKKLGPVISTSHWPSGPLANFPYCLPLIWKANNVHYLSVSFKDNDQTKMEMCWQKQLVFVIRHAVHINCWLNLITIHTCHCSRGNDAGQLLQVMGTSWKSCPVTFHFRHKEFLLLLQSLYCHEGVKCLSFFL